MNNTKILKEIDNLKNEFFKRSRKKETDFKEATQRLTYGDIALLSDDVLNALDLQINENRLSDELRVDSDELSDEINEVLDNHFTINRISRKHRKRSFLQKLMSLFKRR